ncbi:glycoside hydrolase domain-containing protein [Paenibacillus sp. MY03]|uniref:glycoside hydrolase domain-containing protein n=1 Tax=Paenibacillus sp. MY03 TaxID=302980 RepID=UPI00356B6FC5
MHYGTHSRIGSIDEPHLEHLESYRKANEIISAHLSEFPIIDTLSNYAFYETGLVNRPIPG